MVANRKIYTIYKRLLAVYGDKKYIWPQWCDPKKDEYTREVVAVGAILVQRQSWRNADIALRNLKKANLLSLRKIAELGDLKRLTELVRPAGFHRTKPQRLYELCKFTVVNYGTLNRMKQEDMDKLRGELLSVYGVGPETADALLLYALDKPSFVIDEYTRRFVRKYDITNLDKYNELKSLFENSLPKDVMIYRNYHVLIIVDQKGIEGSMMEVV